MADICDVFVRQARNNRWSNHRLHRACAALSEADYFARRPSFFGSIHATLNHTLLVDWLYLERLTGERLLFADWDADLHDRLAPLSADQVKADRAVIAFCEALDPARLDSRVQFAFVNETPADETVASVLLHLFQHQIHHRGQAHDMLSATPVEPPQLDEFFLEADLPRRRDELRALGLAT